MPYPDDLASRFPAAVGAEYADYNNLAKMFRRVDQHDKGDAPNAVTDQEMMGIVAMYQNIDRGRGDLTIDTSEIADPKKAAGIHKGMMDNVAKLLQSKVGREMLADLSDNEHMVDGKNVHRHTALRAFHEDANGDGRNDDWNAPLGEDNSEVVATNPDDERETGFHYEYDKQIAGRGADATVLFNPGGRLPFRSDVVLAHELSHALHTTSGTNDTAPVVKEDGVLSDALCHVERSEHQATGLGRLYGHDRLTQNGYVDDRRAMGENVDRREAYDDNLLCNSNF